jgi:hypothetical protein
LFAKDGSPDYLGVQKEPNILSMHHSEHKRYALLSIVGDNSGHCQVIIIV